MQQRAEDLKNRLLIEIEYVKKFIGDGSWNDICRKEEAYKNNPTQSTYASLKYAIAGFDAKEYSSYEDKVKEIKRNYQADWKKRKDIREAWESLKNSPTSTNWTDFANSCVNSNFWGIGYNNQLVDKENTYSVTTDLHIYKNYYNDLARPQTINVEFISVSGLKNLGSVSGKLRIRFKLGDNMLFDMKFAKPAGRYSWESGQWRQMLKGSINFSASVNIDTRLNYRIYSIGNWSNENTYDNIHVNIIEILVPLVAGESNVHKWYSGDEGVTVGLKFTK